MKKTETLVDRYFNPKGFSGRSFDTSRFGNSAFDFLQNKKTGVGALATRQLPKPVSTAPVVKSFSGNAFGNFNTYKGPKK